MSVMGFPIRHNGTCAGKQVDCGQTVAPYHACCPDSTFCPRAYNVVCCPSAKNCTTTLLKDPQCADRSWDLYDNSGYFCCRKNFVGYAAARSNSDGCAAPGYSFNNGERLLPIISTGTVASSTGSSTGSTPPTSDPTPSPTDPPSDKDGGSGNGPVIGGVVGGVAVVVLIVVSLLWLWRRSKRRGAGASHKLDPAEAGMRQSDAQGSPIHNKENGQNGGLAEMEGGSAPVQLPADQPVELPARTQYNELPA